MQMYSQQESLVSPEWTRWGACARRTHGHEHGTHSKVDRKDPEKRRNSGTRTKPWGCYTCRYVKTLHFISNIFNRILMLITDLLNIAQTQKANDYAKESNAQSFIAVIQICCSRFCHSQDASLNRGSETSFLRSFSLCIC